MVVIRKKHKETPEEKEAREQKEREQAMGLQDNYQARGFELLHLFDFPVDLAGWRARCAAPA